MFCAHCGKELPANAVFCAHCGKKCDIKIELKYSNSGPKQSVAANVSSSFLSDEDKKTLKKIAIIAIPLIAFLIIAVILFLFVSTPKDKNEADLVKDLSSHSNFYPSQDLTITDLSIIKRQTDIDKKMDVIYVDVQAQNEDIECYLSYVLEYHLYNEGWKLDVVTPYNNNKWKISPLKGPSINEADKAVKDDKGSYEFLRYDLDSPNKVCTYYYSVSKEFKYGSQKNTVAARFDYDERKNEWVYDNKVEIDVNTDWKLNGYYYPESVPLNPYATSWYSQYYMNLSMVNESTVNVIVANTYTREVYFEKDVRLSSKGTELTIDVTSTEGSPNPSVLHFYIGVDGITERGGYGRSFSCEFYKD